MQPQHLWWLIGLGLLLAELGLPGLTLFFFGLGAVVTGFVCWAVDIGLTAQVWIFLGVSVGSLVLLRRWMCRIFRGKSRNGDAAEPADEFLGRRVFVTEAIIPERPGRIELNGVNWNAEADRSIAAGAPVLIVGRQGLTLRVQPYEAKEAEAAQKGASS